MSELRGATDIGAFLVSARSFEEYRAMFALRDLASPPSDTIEGHPADNRPRERDEASV